MKRRFAAFAAACLCFAASAVAQTVATTPTTNIESGVYMLRMKSDRTTASAGQWLYYADSYTYAEANDVAGTIVNTDEMSSDQYNYFWNVVKNSDGSITLQSYTAGTYWAQASGANNAYQPNQFPMSSTSHTFKTIADGNAFKLTTVCIKTSGFLNLTKTNKTVYVVDNGVKGNNTARHEMGYSDESSDNGNRASIEFYAVTDIPQAVTFTYNFLYNGESMATESVTGYIGKAYPSYTTTFPAYVTAQKPEDKVTADVNGTTIDLECVANLPFETNKYYYFSCGSDDALTRLTGASSLSYRSTETANDQASTLNDVKNDLWYVTGDPFNGFQFNNVGGNKKAMTSLIASNTGGCKLTYDSATGTGTFKLFKISDETFGIYVYSNWVIGSGNVAWHLEGTSNIYFEKIDLTSTPTDAAYTFRLTEPTISIPLHASAADNNETFATTCLPYAVEVASSDAKAYAGKFVSSNELEMKEVSAVPANQGVILKGNEGVESIRLTVVSSADDIDNDLKGTTEGLSDMTNVLGFGRAGGSGKVGFYTSTNSTLSANRAYVERTVANSVAMKFDGQTTGINAVDADGEAPTNAPVYDLTGRRVSALVKGSLYIQGGKKFIAQ